MVEFSVSCKAERGYVVWHAEVVQKEIRVEQSPFSCDS